MKTTLAALAASIAPAFAQLPPCPLEVQWEISLGAEGIQQLYQVHQTADGGYITGGSQGYWVTRLNPQGAVLWEKLFGQDGSEQLFDLQPTTDGGFILGGGSATPAAGGDKTSPHYGDYDFWIIRLDANGNKLWDRSFGGSAFDVIYGLQQTADGGYILGGISSSPPSGNKTSAAHGGYDFWVVRCDANGNKLWDRSYGGSGREFWGRARQTADGGFVMAGTTDSGATGNKSTPNYGGDDFWIVRLDAAGNKVWDQTYGGSGYEYVGEVVEATGGGFVVTGSSQSPPDGNKTSPQFGDGDGWALGLNVDGTRRWEQSFGGSQSDSLPGLGKTVDGGYVLAGYSFSPADGTRTSATIGVWLVRLDAAGSKLWDYAPGLNRLPVPVSVKQTSDRGFVLAGDTFNQDTSADGFVLKLGPEDRTCDADADGVPDDRDQCPNTRAGDIVNAQGCSIAQLCPCDGPWRNHGEYTRCVQETSAQFEQLGLITTEQRRATVREANLSNCGKR